MSGYTVTLTDAEYGAMKARIAKLEAALCGLVRMHRGLDWLDSEAQAQRWFEAASLVGEGEKLK